jgi:hypothetical protein
MSSPDSRGAETVFFSAECSVVEFASVRRSDVAIPFHPFEPGKKVTEPPDECNESISGIN